LVVWDLEDDVWFSDGLVLLAFEDEQVEIVHQKFRRTLYHLEHGRPASAAGLGQPRTSAGLAAGRAPELAGLTGQRLRDVELLEWTGEDVARGTVAVSFAFPDGQITIYNALDESGMEFGLPDPRYAHHRLER
jgi:hypothetical protein